MCLGCEGATTDRVPPVCYGVRGEPGQRQAGPLNLSYLRQETQLHNCRRCLLIDHRRLEEFEEIMADVEKPRSTYLSLKLCRPTYLVSTTQLLFPRPGHEKWQVMQCIFCH